MEMRLDEKWDVIYCHAWDELRVSDALISAIRSTSNAPLWAGPGRSPEKSSLAKVCDQTPGGWLAP